MPTTDERILQFENMVAADPDNEMAHFSLGSAYLQAGRHAEAAERLQKCVELSPDMSKAYQLAGEAMVGAGWTDRAVDVLNRGYEVAARKGDVMPRDAIAQVLQSIGREPPSLGADVAAAAEALRTSGSFVCQRTGRPGNKLDAPPMRGPLGEWILDNISRETWADWIGQGTKVINELRLDFSREEDQRTYDLHMCEYLGLELADYERMTAPA
jgi:Fe-S cluster biosynthesis and repair protein YggX